MQNHSRIIVVLDYPDKISASKLVDLLSPELCALKVGKELFTATGPEFVENLVKRGYRVFLDLKYHDIPNTVAKACLVAAKLGVWMVNVHTLGGERMLAAAREAIDRSTGQKPLLIGVTMLTSLDDADLPWIGFTGSVQENVLRLSQLSSQVSLDGVVCSAQEAKIIREHCGQHFTLVTPGIRPEGYAAQDDQRRIMTPEQALNAGADYLVIGRPITQAEHPRLMLESINEVVGSKALF